MGAKRAEVETRENKTDTIFCKTHGKEHRARNVLMILDPSSASGLWMFPTDYGNVECYNNDMTFVTSMKSGKVHGQDVVESAVACGLRDALTILDIGAHIGGHTLMFARFAPKATILSFEPQAKLFDILGRNIERNLPPNRDIRLHHAAVGHRSGQTQLSRTIRDCGKAQPVVYGGPAKLNLGGMQLGPDGETVPMIAIDDLKLESCDFIKMDIEGSEILALMGAQKTIERHRPVIMFECGDRKLSPEFAESLGVSKFTLNTSPAHFLNKLGYRVYSLAINDFLAFPSFE